MRILVVEDEPADQAKAIAVAAYPGTTAVGAVESETV